MLIELVIVFSVMAFLFCGSAFFLEKRGSRLSFFLISMILFGLLAITAAEVEVQHCFGGFTSDLGSSDSFCILAPVFDGGLMWVFAGMCTVVMILGFVTLIQFFPDGERGEDFD